MSKYQPIAQKLQELETYLHTLVENLQRGEFPIGLKPVRTIFDRTLTREIPQLQLPPEKFIELYNDIPNLFNAYAITVNLTAATYHQNEQQKAIFERHPQGNYWVIMTKPEQGWLVPNPNRKAINRSLPFAFDSPPDLPSIWNLFLPAIAQILPTEPITWQVTQRGQLGTCQIRSRTSPDVTAIAAEILVLRRDLAAVVTTLKEQNALVERRTNSFTAKDQSLDQRMDGFKQALLDLASKLSK
jgi:hypothetical protein